MSEEVARRCYLLKNSPEIFAEFRLQKHLWYSLFLIMLQTFRPSTLFKSDSSTDVFPWVLRNFWKTVFDRTPLYYSFLCLVLNFERLFRTLFYRAPLGDKLPVQEDTRHFCKSCRISASIYNSCSTGTFQAFWMKTRTNHWNVLI